MVRRVITNALVFAGFGLISALASADENLLGLPKPVDAKQPGAVMLHGGGRMTNETFDRFLELAGGREAKIIFVPSAGYRVDSYLDEPEFLRVVRTRYSSWAALPGLGKVNDFRFLYTDNPEDAESAEFVKPLQEATGVWFSGGFQSRLCERYVGTYPTETRFQKALRGVVERGGIVGGTSAGMAAMPLVTTLWEDRVMRTSPAAAVAGHGFGLLTKTIVEQHFDARGGRLERFTGLLRDNARLDALAGRGVGEQMIGLAVEEHTAVVAKQDKLEVLGENHTHVFFKAHSGRTVTWHELSPGETVKLKRDVPEQRRDPELQLVFDVGTPPSNASAAK